MMPMMQYGDIASVKPAGMPQEIASAINLMAHPTGGAAAVGAIGFGVASHAFGVWLGAMSAAVDATRRFFEEAAPATPAPAAPAPRSNVTRLKLVEKATPAKASSASRASATAKTEADDDLKKISGIGPKLEQVLKKRGIRTIRQIAELDAEAIAALDAEFGLSGRIERDDWVGQAKALSGRK